MAALVDGATLKAPAHFSRSSGGDTEPGEAVLGRTRIGRSPTCSPLPEVLLSSGPVELPSLIYDLQEPGDGAVWCVIAVLEQDRAAFAEALRGLLQQSPIGLKGAVRTLTVALGDADTTHTNPTRLSLRAQTAAALSESLASGEVKLRVEGVAAIEVLS